MAEDTIVRVKRDGTLTITDGTSPTPLSYTIAYEQGDLTLNIPGPTVNAFLDRGQFGTTPSLRYGDDQPITGTFSCYLRQMQSDAELTAAQFIHQQGYFASNWTSTLGANAEVPTCNMTWAVEGSDHGATDWDIALAFVHITGSFSEGDPNVINFSFTAYETYPTVAI